MKKGLLLVVCLLIGISSIWAQQFSAVNADGKTIYYNITDTVNHEVDVSESPWDNQYSGTINIPDSVEYNGVTYLVTGIKVGYYYEESAFYGCDGLTSVTIPNSVTTIGSGAFAECSGLTSVSIPNSVTIIGHGAFYYCSSLTSVTIPNSVTTIEAWAFSDCSSLTSVTIPNSVTIIDTLTFGNCVELTSVTIGNSVTTIGYSAFLGCTNIETLHVMAITPPRIESNSFEGVNYQIPVYVPCEALDAYLNDDQWSYFTNIQCDPSEGIEDVEELLHVSVYPNPTSGMITILAEGVERVEVMNMVGNKVAEFKGELIIDLSEFGSGVYMLRITTKEGTAVRRVIKK